jgi:hypothetical protein
MMSMTMSPFPLWLVQHRRQRVLLRFIRFFLGGIDPEGILAGAHRSARVTDPNNSLNAPVQVSRLRPAVKRKSDTSGSGPTKTRKVVDTDAEETSDTDDSDDYDNDTEITELNAATYQCLQGMADADHAEVFFRCF